MSEPAAAHKGPRGDARERADPAVAELKRANERLEALITRRTAELEKSQRRYRRIFERSKDVILVSTPDGRLIDVNPAGLELYDYATKDEMLALDLRRALWASAADRDRYVQKLRELGYVKDFEADHKTRTGEIIRVVGTTSVVKDSSGAIVELLTICRDITEQKRLQRELFRLATTDSLTGLANRASFRERLELAIAEARRRRGGFALLMLDLDHFKEINDSLGHLAGDAVLVRAAGRFRRNIREVDLLARFGGDEFALLASDADGEASAVEAAGRLVTCLRPPIELEEGPVQTSVSVGVALATAGERVADGLLQRADQALYRAKERGRNRFSL